MVIFTTLAPFEGARIHMQTNAVKSWTLLKPRPRIVVFGVAEKGVRELVASLGIESTSVKRSPEGVPLVSDIFEQGFAMGPGVYVNGDIILTQSFARAFEACKSRFENFVMIGRRHDVAVDIEMPFNAGWEQRLKSVSKPHSVGGIDYFAANRNAWGEIPALAVGRYGWDNWLVYRALRTHATVVNVNAAALVFHQNHRERASRDRPESKRNLKIVGRQLGIISHANWAMRTDYTIKKRGER